MLLELQSPYGLLPFQHRMVTNIDIGVSKESRLNNEGLTKRKK